ncbi:50S ribosomal protein L33 [Candidatus Dependentiae bacterium]|nr:MAG: 50S ribosomal protein L33 [Candidatus Dependentiae bacterium]
MAKNRVTTHLACKECKERNYSQVVSKNRKVGALQLKKFCSRCRKHTEHKETK